MQQFEEGDLDVKKLNQKVDDIYNSLCACISSHCVSKDDFNSLLIQKASKEDLNMIMLQKVDKQQVANALQRKATKAELSQFDAKVTAIALQVQEMHMAISHMQDGHNQKIDEIKTMFERQKESYSELLQSEMQSTSTEIENALHRKLTRDLEQHSEQQKRLLENQERRVEDSLRTMQLRVDNMLDIVKQESVVGYKRERLEQSQEQVKLFERQVRTQISELKEVAGMFQRELSKIQDAESAIKGYVTSRLEEAERMYRSQCDRVAAEVSQIGKDTYKELEQVDHEMQKLRQQIINIGFDRQHDISMQSSPRNQARDMESIRHEISQLRGVLDFVKEDVSQKSYIKDVCVLVDMKANQDDMEKRI